MATQLQLRRGTTAQNNEFTGAVGEITIDTTTKSIRIHDGVTVGGRNIPTYSGEIPVGGDYVIEMQTGLSGTNYSNGWYRLYNSGWVEQGFYGTTSAVAITLPIAMANANYAGSANSRYTTVTTEAATTWINAWTSTTVTVRVVDDEGDTHTDWPYVVEVKGMSA